MLLTPCELAVRDILPAVRALIVIQLRDMGFKQKEIAKLLNLTQPAVSYYLNRRRAKKIVMLQGNEEIMKEIKRFVEKLLSNQMDQKEISNEFCHMCSIARELIYDDEKKLKIFKDAECDKH